MFLFADSFDFYAALGNASTRWSLAPLGYGFALSSSTAFSSGQAMAYDATSNCPWKCVWPSNEATLFLSVRMLWPSGNTGTCAMLFQLADNGTPQVTFRFVNDGTLVILSGDSRGDTIATIPGFTSADTWASYQLKVVIGAAGSVEVRRNGATASEYTYNNVNTLGGTGNAYANSLVMTGNGGGVTTLFLIDDLFVCSGAGAVPNTWPGDIRALQQMPSGQVQSQMAAVNAGSNWQAVSETHQDGDNSYVSSSTVGQEDIYTLSPVLTSYAVVGVNYVALWKKTDAGARSAQLSVAANGSADTPVITNAALSQSYAYSTAFLAFDPTGAAWTPAAVNGAKLGLKVAA